MKLTSMLAGLTIKILFITFIILGTFLPVLTTLAADLKAEKSRPRIGLALGSGGALGLAHIAMLQVFDDLGIKPDRISGTSIGAVIGALYASGLSAAEIRDIFDEFSGSKLDALSELMSPNAELTIDGLINFETDAAGLLDSAGFLAFLSEKTAARTFADLEIPLKIVSTDYWSGQSVVIKNGDLFKAIEASMAVPGLFEPVERGDTLLIDGGTSNPLPFDLLQDHCDLVVAIDVTGSRVPQKNEPLGLTDIFFSTFEIMQQSLIARQRRDREPDIYIKPETHNIRLLHFNRIESIIDQAASAAVKLRQQLSSKLNLWRSATENPPAQAQGTAVKPSG